MRGRERSSGVRRFGCRSVEVLLSGFAFWDSQEVSETIGYLKSLLGLSRVVTERMESHYEGQHVLVKVGKFNPDFGMTLRVIH